MDCRRPNHTRAKLGHVPALDGLRGIAILFVMGNHAPLRHFGSLLPGGFAGVDIFFVLSGFLISTLLVQEFDETGTISLRRFYARRALRLGPALILLLIVLCSLSFVLLDQAHAHANCINALIALFYASNWVRIFSSNQLGVLAHTWSLSAEEQFYLVWPVILLMLLRVLKKRRYIVLIAALLALLSWAASIGLALNGATFLRISFGLDSRGEALMVGCILGVALASGLITERATAIFRKTLVIGAPLAMAGLIAFAIFGNFFGRGFFYFGFEVIALLSAALILDVIINSRSLLKRVFEMKWLVWIGQISYGLYLWHWPIFYSMQYTFHCQGWTVVLVGTPLAFLCVLLSYYGLERPILKFKKRFNPVSSQVAK